MKKSQISPNTVVFFGILLFCILAFLLLPKRDFAEREKRYLAEFPTLSADAVLDGSFQKGLETWFSDRFPFRSFWVGVNSYLGLLEGRNLQNEVYFCKEDYLINAPKEVPLTQFQKNLAAFDAFAGDTGLPASLLIVPTTGYLNEPLLPAGHPALREEEAYAWAGESLHNISLVDAREALLAANREKAVAYRTDHHLTAWGAYTLYTCWSPNPRPASAYTVRSFEGFCGTTWSSSGYWLVPPDTLELWDDGGDYTVTIRESGSDTVTHAGLFFEEHLAALDAYPVYLDGNHPLTVIENAAAPGGTLLVVKDSYAHAFATLAAGDYSRIVLVDLRYYRAPVSALAERYEATELLFLYGLDNLLTDTNSAWLT